MLKTRKFYELIGEICKSREETIIFAEIGRKCIETAKVGGVWKFEI